jgi:DNA-binding SARP family transcriptional activator
LLGAPDVQVAGSLLTLNHQKARALLYYLAATGQPHTRDHLATLLWSESSDRDARHSLRSDLYRLRQALRLGDAAAVLSIDGDLIALQPAEYDCDVLRFRRLATENTESSWREAVALYRGSLFEGFTLVDAPLFDDWVRLEEATLNRAYLQLLDRLATQAESRQAWLDAIGHVQRMVHLDPLSEEAQQRLIKLYLRQHAVGSALRQYQHFEAVLKQELVLPAAETGAHRPALRQPQRGVRRWHFADCHACFAYHSPGVINCSQPYRRQFALYYPGAAGRYYCRAKRASARPAW